MINMFAPYKTPLCMLNSSYLNDDEKRIFRSIVKALDNEESSITIRGINPDRIDMNRVINSLMCDVWYAYVLDPNCSEICSFSDEMHIKLNYIYDAHQRKELRTHLDCVIRNIIKSCKCSAKTDYEKVLYIHNYLADSVTYIHDKSIANKTGQSVVGALLEHIAVCAGIGKAAEKHKGFTK